MTEAYKKMYEINKKKCLQRIAQSFESQYENKITYEWQEVGQFAHEAAEEPAPHHVAYDRERYAKEGEANVGQWQVGQEVLHHFLQAFCLDVEQEDYISFTKNLNNMKTHISMANLFWQSFQFKIDVEITDFEFVKIFILLKNQFILKLKGLITIWNLTHYSIFVFRGFKVIIFFGLTIWSYSPKSPVIMRPTQTVTKNATS